MSARNHDQVNQASLLYPRRVYKHGFIYSEHPHRGQVLLLRSQDRQLSCQTDSSTR